MRCEAHLSLRVGGTDGAQRAGDAGVILVPTLYSLFCPEILAFVGNMSRRVGQHDLWDSQQL